MTALHQDPIQEAKKILGEKGFKEDQIYEEFGFKDHQIDVVGWSEDKKIAIECGHCDWKKLRDLEKFFDEVICIPSESQTSPLSYGTMPPEAHGRPPLGRLAGLKLLLAKDDNVLLEMPLSTKGWSRNRLEDELQSLEEQFNGFSKLFDALSHETRLRMMKHLLEDEDQTITFAEFMRDLSLNPKTVWENARKLTEGGFIKKTGRGEYSFSEFGETGFMMISLALRHLMEALEEFENL
jgi:DNA-binding transcriptional ArsR family regulator